MRFFKILFKIILVVLLLLSFTLEYDIINFDNGFKFAKFESRSDLLSNTALDIKAVTVDYFPLVNIYVVTAKDKDGQPHIVFDTKANKQIKQMEEGSTVDLDVKDIAYLTALKLAGKDIGHKATNPLIYLVVLFGLLMIPTKKIRKPVNSRR